MTFLLRLKHWQLFLMTWGIGLGINIVTMGNLEYLMIAFPIMMIFFVIGTYGWVWAIAVGLHSLLPENVKLKVTLFKVLFSIPIIYIMAILVFISTQSFLIGQYGDASPGFGIEPAFGIIGIIVLHLGSICIAIWGFRFAAKTLRSVELGREAHFSDYMGEFFLIWFSIVGYWVIQPRLNKLIENNNMNDQ